MDGRRYPSRKPPPPHKGPKAKKNYLAKESYWRRRMQHKSPSPPPQSPPPPSPSPTSPAPQIMSSDMNNGQASSQDRSMEARISSNEEDFSRRSGFLHGMERGSVSRRNWSGEVRSSNQGNTTVFVCKLDYQVTADHLHYMFRKTLVVRDITILSVRVVPNKGYAFVQFSRHAEARFAIEVCNGLMICGRRIKCAWGRGRR